MASYRKRENGKWEYRISYKTHDGKYKKAERVGFPTKKAVQIAVAEREKELPTSLSCFRRHYSLRILLNNGQPFIRNLIFLP